MASIRSNKEVTTILDEQGNVKVLKTETTTKIERVVEPNYIKLYTRIWCEFNGIPRAYRSLFLELAMRMTYCSIDDLKHAQIVSTGEPYKSEIMHTLGWKVSMYNTGLRVLCDCGAIRRVGRGVYQINPLYAGKGEWKYNPRLRRGGVEDLVAKFNFKTGEVETQIIWADDGVDDETNKLFREGVGVKPEQETVITHSEATVINGDESCGGMASLSSQEK